MFEKNIVDKKPFKIAPRGHFSPILDDFYKDNFEIRIGIHLFKTWDWDFYRPLGVAVSYPRNIYLKIEQIVMPTQPSFAGMV